MLLWYRRRPAVVILSLCLCTLYWAFLDWGLNGDGFLIVRLRAAVGLPDAAQLHKAEEAVERLEHMLHQYIPIADLSGMAERVEALSSLAQATAAEPLLDKRPLDHLVQRLFPWLDAVRLPYVPWSAQPSPEVDGTGLVMCVGDGNFLFAAHLIRTLRNVLGSTLPIQIAYSGEGDLSPQKRQALVGLASQIETIDLLDVFPDERLNLKTAGWGQKPFALLASRFRRAILVDADVTFLRKPDDLFETEQGLVDTGTLFWHDRAIQCSYKPVRDWLQSVMGDRQPSEMLRRSEFWKDDIWHQMESGMVAMDKSRVQVFTTLLFVAWMNGGDVRDAETYQHMWGDKETYWIAAELTSTPYHFIDEYGGTIGSLGDDNSTICGTHIAHTDSKKKLFWFNGSLRENKYRAGRDLARLTHLIIGGTEFSEQPKWNCHSDGMVWCLTGDEPVSLAGTVEDALIEDMKREAAAVDEMFTVEP
ncbi:MAG: hypothetical protein M1832_003902 [Thelocarpon impressellum]|nr:MAG: hypothetical protein M1832_003902 [Thelocarpon impressellum]